MADLEKTDAAVAGQHVAVEDMMCDLDESVKKAAEEGVLGTIDALVLLAGGGNPCLALASSDAVATGCTEKTTLDAATGIKTTSTNVDRSNKRSLSSTWVSTTSSRSVNGDHSVAEVTVDATVEDDDSTTISDIEIGKQPSSCGINPMKSASPMLDSDSNGSNSNKRNVASATNCCKKKRKFSSNSDAMAMIDNEMTTMNVAIQEHNYIERRSSEATLWNSSKDDLLKMIDETMMTMTTAMNDRGLVN